jgi:carbonic anhydrase
MTNDVATFIDDAHPTRLHDDPSDPRPARQIAVVTCMDTRIDPLRMFGLDVGEAHVLRNAGGRVTEDVLRSVAFASHLLGVDTVVVVHHTGCGLVGRHDDELRATTGTDFEFRPIIDHDAALRADVAVLAAAPYLGPVRRVGAFLLDLANGDVEEHDRWSR